jgi:hypothetical protein
MFFQHNYVSTNHSKKLDASLGFFQLQVSTQHNPFTQDYSKWVELAPLSWVKMLWKSLHYVNLTLYMSFPTIKPPRECDQVIMEIILSQYLDLTKIARINRCHVYLEASFLSDIMTADGKYLENFLFKPGGKMKHLRYKFSREQPS